MLVLLRYELLLIILMYSFSLLFSQTISDEYEEYINVVVFNNKDEKYVPHIKKELAKAIVKFQFDVKSFPDIEVTINIAPDKATYREWTNDKEVVFENSNGFADLRNNQIYINNPRYLGDNKSLIRLLLHEYIHLFINYHWKDAPLWFHEGMAMYFTGSISINHIFRFTTNNALHSNYLLTKYAYEYPKNRAEIEPYYFQAALLIKKIVDDDKQRLYNLFEISTQYSTFNSAFEVAFKENHEDFLTSFEDYTKAFLKINIYKGIILFTWLSFPIILIIAKFKKNHKTRKLLERWEIDEIKEEIEAFCMQEMEYENEKTVKNTVK